MKPLLSVALFLSLIATPVVQAATEQTVDDLFNEFNARQQNTGTPPASVVEHAAAIRQAILDRMDERARSRVKSSTLHVRFDRAGVLLSVACKRGDDVSCSELMNAARRASFPAFPNDEIYQAFRDIELNFL